MSWEWDTAMNYLTGAFMNSSDKSYWFYPPGFWDIVNRYRQFWIWHQAASNEWRDWLRRFFCTRGAVYSTGVCCYVLSVILFPGSSYLIVKLVNACWDGELFMFNQQPFRTDCVQVRAQFTRGVYFAPLNIYRKSLSSPHSLWDRQQPKLLSGTAILEPCAACFVDNLQTFPRKAALTSEQGAFQTDEQTDTCTHTSTRFPQASKILNVFAWMWDEIKLQRLWHL